MNPGCDTLIVCSKTMSCWPSSGRRWDGAIGNRGGTAVRPRRPRSVLRLLILKHVRNWSFAVLGTRGARQCALPSLHPHRMGSGSRRQDLGAHRSCAGAGSDRQTARTLDRDGAPGARRGRPQAAHRYDRGRNQRALSDRFEPVGGRTARADADDASARASRRWRGREVCGIACAAWGGW